MEFKPKKSETLSLLQVHLAALVLIYLHLQFERIHHMNTRGGQAGRTEMKVVRLVSGGGPAVRN
jgi:hypothetical protein